MAASSLAPKLLAKTATEESVVGSRPEAAPGKIAVRVDARTVARRPESL